MSQHSESAIQSAGMIAALSYIDGVGFHAIATSLGGPSPTIKPDWSGLTHNARTAVAAIDWPDEIQQTAETFAAAAGRLAAALDQRDTQAAANPAKELHAAYHALSDAGWSYLAKAAGIPGEDQTHHHGHPHQAQ